MGHAQPTTLAVAYSATGNGFVNYNIHQRCSRAIDMRFYWVRDRVRQGQFLVYWMAGEKNLAGYFTKNHPIIHHQAQQSIYLVPTADARNYECYMSHIDLQGCVEYLLTQGNGQRTDTVSLLREKETDNGRTETTGQIGYHGIGGYNIGLIGPPLI